MKYTFRSLWIVAVAASIGAAQGQAWEKPIAPGVTYRMEVDLAIPRIIHALRFSMGSPTVKMVPELGSGVVYQENSTKGRETVTDMVTRTGALAGVNADFFPFTGDPLGVMVRDGRLVSVPSTQRAVFGWGQNTATQALVGFKGTVEVNGTKLELDGLNEECPVNKMVLNTDVTSLAMSKTPCVHAVLTMDDASWAPNGTYTGTFQSIFKDAAKLPIQPGNAILTASGTKTPLLENLVPGQKVSISFSTTGFDWSKIDQTVGGGPFLVKDGQLSVDADKEGFNDAFTNKRHPRTAIGKTVDGDIWLVVVDGRQKISDGATLPEMGKVMLKLGCTDAINLDGGGSSALNILGLTLSRPSDGRERPVANGVLIMGPKPVPSTDIFAIKAPSKLVVGTPTTVQVLDSQGVIVPNAEVLWSSLGDAWIDQGGLIRPFRRGKMDVSALVRGQLVKATIDVVDPEKPATPPKAARKTKKAKRA
ncbi:MAG: hypothetical protein BGO01_18620 [Armatimonadetes bacterium 55-13]|nr:MAG: hypothetical protein BGO01_18620 [Armatimonadetes bacterium 55-13]